MDFTQILYVLLPFAFGDVVENGVAAEVCIVWSVEVLDLVTTGSEEGVWGSGEELNVE